MKKIRIPENIRCFSTSYGPNYHVQFSDEKRFEVFCDDNNIGYGSNARKDVIKSDLHVFTSNKDVFENFPEKFEQLLYTV